MSTFHITGGRFSHCQFGDTVGDGAAPAESPVELPDGSDFDVFLCYNPKDRDAVRDVAAQLRARSVRPWFDEWALRPGVSRQREIARTIQVVASAAVFVGNEGIAPWQEMETEALIRRLVVQHRHVIPVLLPTAAARPALPLFLEGQVWVDLRDGAAALDRLVWGITGCIPVP